jgi:hypothetical protein
MFFRTCSLSDAAASTTRSGCSSYVARSFARSVRKPTRTPRSPSRGGKYVPP